MALVSFRDFSKNFCDDEEQVRVEATRSCSEFMWAVLEGYSLDREASGFAGMSDVDLQANINKWTRDPTGSPNCSFYKFDSKVIQVCCPGWSGNNCNIRKLTKSLYSLFDYISVDVMMDVSVSYCCSSELRTWLSEWWKLCWST